jgi:hypothetical protein
MLLKQASAPGYLFLTGLRRSDLRGEGISGKIYAQRSFLL